MNIEQGQVISDIYIKFFEYNKTQTIVYYKVKLYIEENLYLERSENGRKFMNISEYYIKNKCHVFPFENSECKIFSLTCKKYAAINMEVAEK